MEHGADPSIKAVDTQPVDAQPNDDQPAATENVRVTAFDLAKQNPLGALWFDEKGELRSVSPQSRRGSVATVIDDSDVEGGNNSGTETGGTTVTGGSSVGPES